MKLCIDLTPLTPNPSGVGIYVLNLVSALQKLQATENFHLSGFYQPRLAAWLQGKWKTPAYFQTDLHLQIDSTVFPCPVRVSNRLVVSSPTLLSHLLTRLPSPPDVLHGTNYSVVPWPNCRKVITIYDLSFIRYPQFADRVSQSYGQQLRYYLPYADLILTISESAKQDIIEYFNLSPEKVIVTYLASRYDGNLPTKSTPKVTTTTLSKNLDRPYILFVGTLEPRKNLVTLISAFNHLKERCKIDHNLILVGRRGWKYNPIFEAIKESPWQSFIHHFNYLPNHQLEVLYKCADVFVFPSYYEGFGLPLLEAMALGCPVITSNAASLPEVAGEAALLVSPKDLEGWFEAIKQVIFNPSLRQSLIDLGYQQAQRFSWEKTAIATLNAYRSVL